jgi:hypothetical protein
MKAVFRLRLRVQPCAMLDSGPLFVQGHGVKPKSVRPLPAAGRKDLTQRHNMHPRLRYKGFPTALKRAALFSIYLIYLLVYRPAPTIFSALWNSKKC